MLFPEQSQIEQLVQIWFKNIENWEPPAYLVGGAVRDMLLGKNAKDIDIAYANAKDLAVIMRKKHNAAMISLFDDSNIKTTYRLVKKDSKDEIDISTFQGKDIKSDLLNRDFTINSMAVSINKDSCFEDLIDFYNGKDDLLKFKQIRMTSPNSFKDDPLRILRGYRFSCVLDFKIGQNTRKMIQNDAMLLKKAAAERQIFELKLIFSSDYAYRTIYMMDEDNVLEVIFPEILPMKGCLQNRFHHLDVFQHSLKTLYECENIIKNLNNYFGEMSQNIFEYLCKNDRLYLIKFAALLHDIAKPCVRQILLEKNQAVFYSHDKIGSKMIRNIGERLKMSNDNISYIANLVEKHMHAFDLSKPHVNEKTIIRWFRNVGDDCIALIILSIADSNSALGVDASIDAKKKFTEWSKNTLNKYFYGIKKKIAEPGLISGNDLIKIGFEQGPMIGKILNAVREAQDTGEISNRFQALELAYKLKK